jgi:(2Fe-2S) ferredoxin
VARKGVAPASTATGAARFRRAGKESTVTAEADPPPFFRAHVFVCCNRRPEGHHRGSCAARGSERLRDYMKARAKELGLKDVRVNMAGCLDRCEFGPTLVVYPEGVWYRPRTTDDVDEILRAHLQEGGRARRLMLTERDVAPPKG